LKEGVLGLFFIGKVSKLFKMIMGKILFFFCERIEKWIEKFLNRETVKTTALSKNKQIFLLK